MLAFTSPYIWAGDIFYVCVIACGAAFFQRTAISVAMTAPDAVVDLHDECSDWAKAGECNLSPISMLTW